MIRLTRHPARVSRAANATRIAVGIIWIAGAIWNLAFTTRMDAPYDWLTKSPVEIWRWFFREIVQPQRVTWTVLLAMYELAIGVLTLGGGARARLGLAGGMVFSAFLFSLMTPYTLVMGPYAALLAWLARKDFRPVLYRR